MEPDSQLSPGLLRKVTHAAASSSSFAAAEKDLNVLAEVRVSAARIRRAAEAVGGERVAECQARAERFEQLPLPTQHQASCEGVPELACIQTDGGRIQIRPRQAGSAEADKPDSWWRETKVACLLSMTSSVQAEDPTPQLPKVFVDRRRMREMVREIKGFSSIEETAEPPPEAISSHRPPDVVEQTVLATRENIEGFGRRLAALAHAKSFAAAPRKAFLGDGSETNWSLHRRHFSHYTPILDWVHAVCYVYAAAMAGVSVRDGWAAYCQWAQWLWSGQVDLLLDALRLRQEQLGAPAEHDETSPARQVADTLRYVTNQRGRMNYPEYRKQGLPITSSHIESTIKRINRRLKGSDKFWDAGAEPLLHLVADQLGPQAAMRQFWARRPQTLNRQRCYQSK
jgi:hypothetical protein